MPCFNNYDFVFTGLSGRVFFFFFQNERGIQRWVLEKMLGEDRQAIGRVVLTRGRVQGEAKQGEGHPASGRKHFWCGQENEVGRTE